LGGHVEKIPGSDIAKTIASYAKEKQIQLLVIGRSVPGKFSFLGKSIVDKLMVEIEQEKIDIQIVSP
jgi:K+-sensing histidine kinase KdpD